MMVVFIVIQALQALLSVSLGPLANLIAIAYGVSLSRVNFTYGIGLIACILAFYPTNIVIGKRGIRVGLSMALFGATIGGALCCMININFSLFLLGYFIMHFCLTAVHSAKGNFINLFYSEKQVRFICNKFHPLESRSLLFNQGGVPDHCFGEYPAASVDERGILRGCSRCSHLQKLNFLLHGPEDLPGILLLHPQLHFP